MSGTASRRSLDCTASWPHPLVREAQSKSQAAERTLQSSLLSSFEEVWCPTSKACRCLRHPAAKLRYRRKTFKSVSPEWQDLFRCISGLPPELAAWSNHVRLQLGPGSSLTPRCTVPSYEAGCPRSRANLSTAVCPYLLVAFVDQAP